MFKITLGATCAKKLSNFDNLIRNRIENFIDEKLTTHPKQNSIIMTNRNGLHRARVGDYRIIFQLDLATKSIIIVDIDHRSKIYK